MNNNVQYEINIGCNDQHNKEEIVNSSELLKIVNDYFLKKKINYSAQEVEGGYHHKDGVYMFEKTLCITVVGDQDFDIVKFAKGLSMYMNQECFMITKENILEEYR